MTGLLFLVLAVLATAGVLLFVLVRPTRQEITMHSRRFELFREVDVSGVSGTGVVAEGVAFSDGTAVIRWVAGEHRSTVVWPDVASVEAIHGHNGTTRIRWVDA